jgi:hypothetical protein
MFTGTDPGAARPRVQTAHDLLESSAEAARHFNPSEGRRKARKAGAGQLALCSCGPIK